MITYAYIETTSYCNVDCRFCNRKEVITGEKHMSLDQFDYVLKQLKPHNITEAKLMGMGEPFMHPQFHEICRRFKEQYPSAFLISATNGQLKFNDNYRKAMQYIDMLYISIDGAKENYETIRAGSKWEKLLTFLTRVREYHSEGKSACQTPINYTITPDNVYDIPAMLDLIHQYGLTDLRLNFVQNWTEEEHADVLNGFTQEQLDYLHQFKRYFKGKSEWNYSDCFWPKNGLYMTVDGNVKVCCMNTSAKSLGNIFQQPIQLIHSSKEMVNIREGCATNNPTSHCKNCSYKELTPFLQKIL